MKREHKKILILALVFFTSTCSLVVEVVALRVLSPYFGNTIFTASSVIGTVLGALSLGYYVGGRLADKYNKISWMMGLVFMSGLSVLAIEAFQVSVLPILAPKLSLTAGPLISSVALFFLPSLFLGALSPFAVAILHDDAAEGVARLTGAVFFWSTSGSIAGSLLSGFVLVPNFGIDKILLGVGLVLSLLGLIAILILNAGRRKFLFLGAFFAVNFVGFASWQSRPILAGVIYSQDGVYESLSIRDGQAFGRPVRYFFQDKSYSGAMFLDSQYLGTADDMVFDYTKYYAAYREFKPDLQRAMVIGGGAYTVPKALLNDPSVIEVQVAEIEPSLPELGRKYFRVPDDPRLVSKIEDGRRLLTQADQPLGLIFSDVYFSLFSIPAHFTTQEFFELAKSKLDQDGMFMANLIGDLSRQEPSFLMSEIKTFQRVFPNAVAIGTSGQRTRELQNVMLIGVNSSASAVDVAERLRPLAQKLGGEIVDLDRFEFEPYAVLTDDYSPVDHLTASGIGRMSRAKDSAQPNGHEMLATIEQQLLYGSRAVGSQGHDKIRKFIMAEASALGLQVQTQDWTQGPEDGASYGLSNIIVRLNPEAKKRFVVATHYDTRARAENDKKHPNDTMPGANDGASGVAVLLELARALSDDERRPSLGIDFVFFDGEEGLPGKGDWRPVGSEYFAQRIGDLYGKDKPIGAMVLDMVCDEDAVLSPETSSLRFAPSSTHAFWSLAADKYPNIFKFDGGAEIWDDHTPLNASGIPAFLVIGWDYPFFHTTQDTADKCSAERLENVTEAVLDYIQTMD